MGHAEGLGNVQIHEISSSDQRWLAIPAICLCGCERLWLWWHTCRANHFGVFVYSHCFISMLCGGHCDADGDILGSCFIQHKAYTHYNSKPPTICHSNKHTMANKCLAILNHGNDQKQVSNGQVSCFITLSHHKLRKMKAVYWPDWCPFKNISRKSYSIVMTNLVPTLWGHFRRVLLSNSPFHFC